MAIVHYATLADRIGRLPLSANCADLAASVQAYLDEQGNDRQDLTAAIRELPPETQWLRGLFSLCEALQTENARFDPGMFMDWVTERL